MKFNNVEAILRQSIYFRIINRGALIDEGFVVSAGWLVVSILSSLWLKGG